MHPGPDVVDIAILSEKLVGREGGFLAVHRFELANVRADGSRSAPYLCDFVIRPKGVDAVVVAIFTRRADGRIDVLLRCGLRPPLALGRPPDRPPVPDARRYLFLEEVVAGIVEPEDRGEEGIRRRAAVEVEEEAGLTVDPARVILLGAAPFATPGAMAERFWLTAVEVDDPGAARPPQGDGSPMEEGASIRWLELDQAIEACVRGEIEDLKTELVLRRLRESL